MPVWLIVLLSVLALLLVAGVAVASVLLVRNSSGESSGEARSGDVASPSVEAEETDSEDPETEDPDEPDEEEGVSTLDLKVGHCFDLPEVDDEDEMTDGVVLIDCSDSHDAEVYAAWEIETKAFPGDEATDTMATDGCEERFEDFVGMAYADSILDFYYFYPTAKSWTYGDRAIACAVLEPTGPEGEDVKPVTGSLRGAKR